MSKGYILGQINKIYCPVHDDGRFLWTLKTSENKSFLGFSWVIEKAGNGLILYLFTDFVLEQNNNTEK